MRKLLAVTLATAIAGCAASKIRYASFIDKELVDYPGAGKSVTRGLGERLVAKGVRIAGDALEVTQPTQFGKAEDETSIGTCAATVLPSFAFQRGVYEARSRRGDCFGPFEVRATTADGTTNWNCRGGAGSADICKDTAGRYFLVAGGGEWELEQDFDNFKRTTKVVEGQDNFVQEMIYNGRVGRHLKFVYREFSGNMIRPAFTQEVQYDLSESRIIGFKNLRLEVVRATNTEITYRLIQNF